MLQIPRQRPWLFRRSRQALARPQRRWLAAVASQAHVDLQQAYTSQTYTAPPYISGCTASIIPGTGRSGDARHMHPPR